MNRKLTILFIALITGFTSFAQTDYLNAKADKDKKIYSGGEPYKVTEFAQIFKTAKPKNIILLIGDGMGVSQIHAGLTANNEHLFLENFRHMGLTKTHSADNYITDSAAGGTALATGEKTYNGAISVDTKKKPLKTILEEAAEQGLATGLVSTSSITHATPASFIAHQPSRNMYEAIAADFLKTDIDLFIGGGYKHFTDRQDGRNLADELKQKGYTVKQDLNNIQKENSEKLAVLTASEHNGRVHERGNMLPVAVSTAITRLSQNEKGFFLMAEASQIDWGGHAGDTHYIIEEILDFDRTVGKVLEFASKNGETLVIVASDHETGGMAVLNGNFETGMVQGEFTTGGHTGIMVPVFAYGPGAGEFTGIMDNTDVHKKMKKLLFNP